MSSIGVDIGASHISCGLYNSEYDKLECKIYFPNRMNRNIDINSSTKLFIRIVIELLDRLIKENDISIDNVTSLGIGCPGGIDKDNVLFLGSSSLNVKEINWRKELKKYNTEVFVENDCTCAGICESYVNNINNFLMFTLGSGLGMAYMYNYQCIDQIIWDISELNKKVGNKHDKYIKGFESLSNKYNEYKKGKYERGEIFKCIEEGDIRARNILRDYIKNFIEGIVRISEKYDIKDFSIGGGMSEYSKYFIDEIKKSLPDLNIHIAKYRNDSGIIGAALLEKVSNNNIFKDMKSHKSNNNLATTYM